MRLLAKPIKMPLTIYQGATFERQWRWLYKPSAGADPMPVVLTGCTARGQVRETYESSSVLVDFVATDGSLVLDTAQSTISLFLSPTKTAVLKPSVKPYRWDLEIYWPDGNVTRLFEGEVTISQEVTR
ncbi:MAG: hypothetical protein ABTR07_15325 [Candidatus Competibacter denitrificans]